ncbi:MAG: hypothetical protein PHP50_10145 [Lachnospiraceae bacterium]|nr:hypothetical protein [Lachnospiraceae bacterium]
MKNYEMDYVNNVTDFESAYAEACNILRADYEAYQENKADGGDRTVLPAEEVIELVKQVKGLETLAAIRKMRDAGWEKVNDMWVKKNGKERK